MPTARVNGIDVYYEIRGDGPPLVLIPGLGTDITEYERVIAPLAKACRVLAADNRGAGRSDQPDVPYTVETMAEDTSGLLAALGIGPAFVLGHSLGGRIALALTLAHPEQVKGLVLVSTAARLVGVRRRIRFLGSVTRRTPGLRSMGQYPQSYSAFLRQFEASTGYDGTPRLHEIRVPTLILHGTRDRIVPLARAEELHAGIAGSRLLSFRGGHLMLFLRPGPCTEAIASFVRAP